MYSLDPKLCHFYQLLPDDYSQTPGQSFTGDITVEWRVLRDGQSKDTLYPIQAVFSYTSGHGIPWGQIIPIYDILKGLKLGSAYAIRFPAALLFPGPGLDEQAVLILTVRKIAVDNARRERLTLLDEVPRGVGGLFYEAMSHSKWNPDIQKDAEKWESELEHTSRAFWFQYSITYCEKFDRRVDILKTFLTNSSKVLSFHSPV
ncbi:regulatory particle non-ATPase [Microsporum canis]|uniref:Uncharacterized protein n=1 Tax=Arthroderma otae (strain ATCC MYA-4605 / CBS 113480) TaxID=554155 RepID=C5FJ98_ARTOC|nr:uncharacterized protein MCYG_02338 [Microsporum canis CBS 113480]EEQ29519.1 predicted protein [Microsporum canis CBS 113480]